MKKALIIATVGGFLSKFEMNNVKLLQELGYEVHYASNLNNRIYEFEEQELERKGVILHHVDICKSPFHIVRLIKAIGHIKKLIAAEGIALIHCHTPVGGVLGRAAARSGDRKPYVIYTAHGFHFYKGAPLQNWLLYYPVEYILSRYTDCLITINREDYARSKKMQCKKCVQIPGVGLDDTVFRPTASAGGKNEREFRIVSVGELNENKNHEIVIKTIAALNDPDITYYIYGRGPKKEYLEELIEKAHLTQQVRLCGYHTHIEEKLAEADCFIFPSKREGFGMAALEAMACNVPIIVADNRGTREYAVDGENAIVCHANNEQEFRNAVLRIKNKKALRDKLAQNALITVQNFTLDKNEKVMRLVYEEV